MSWIRTVCMLAIVSSLGVFAAQAPQQPAFKTEQGRKALEAAKKAFESKNLKEAKKQLSIAAREAANTAAKKLIQSYKLGLRGLQDLLVIETRKKTYGGWAYENAQRKYLVYYLTPVRPLYEQLIRELESPERKLVTKIETFETGGPYSVRFGKTFVHRVQFPAFVVEGQRSLRWECKNRKCLVLKFPKVPRDWSGYQYLGFWMYQEKRKNSGLQLFVVCGKPGGAQRKLQRSFNGFQAKIPAHVGWKFIVLPLKGGKGFRRVGRGNYAEVQYLQIQLPNVKPFLCYVDNVVLVRKN